MSALIKFAEGWWWLAFIFGGGITASAREALRMRHKRRMEILQIKAQAPGRRGRAAAPPPAAPADPQPVCGCTHHLSFHNPQTSTCAFEGCRCQQYVGPEPLGHVVALPLVDPSTMHPDQP